MSLDSDSDLQAYINELSRKAQDWQYEDEESALDAVSTPSLSSSIEIVVSKKEEEKFSRPAAQQQTKSNIIRDLEVKYLKKVPRSVVEDISFSLSENDLEIGKENVDDHSLESERSATDQEQKTIPSNLDSASKKESYNEINEKDKRPKLQIQEQTSIPDDKIEFSRTPSYEEDVKGKRIKFRRRSSDTSLLINKSGIFYSSSLTTDKPSNLSSQSSSKISSESDSISEEIPELEHDEAPKPRKIEKLISRQESVLYSVKESPETSQKDDSEVSADYGAEDTFESTEETSSMKNKSVESEQESAHEQSVASENSEDEKTDNESEEEISESSEKNYVNTKSNESNESVSQMSHESSRNLKSSHGETTNESQVSRKSDSEKRSHKERNVSKRKKDKKTRQVKSKSKSSSPRRKRPPSSRSSVSSLDSSSESSTASSTSFYVKMKRKKYKEKKRRLKREKETTELVIKTLVKNLPLILRHSIGMNVEPTPESRPRYVCRNCGGESSGWEVANRRIDDALRQTVNLTREFLETHRTLLETEYRIRNSNFKYTRLKHYSVG